MDGQDADLLEANHRVFAELVNKADRLVAAKRVEPAAVAAQIAATYAWFNHPGTFTSLRLERVLHTLGSALQESVSPLSTRSGIDVVHVATQAYPTGGHTRALVNWLNADHARRAELIVTAQGARPLPRDLVAAMARHGRIHLLDRQSDRLIDRARLLRSLTHGVPSVLLHVHPNDVVPSIGLPAPHEGATRVLLVNHADHVFWVGAQAVDAVLDMRASGAELSQTRRLIDRDRLRLLIRPLELKHRTISRAAARGQLEIPPKALLIATAASATKYDPVNGIGFLDFVLPALARLGDRAVLLAAGPSPQGSWAELERKGAGRALGLLEDVEPLLSAADVYIDSYPFSSLTSMLEAASLGTPVITLQPDGADAGVLGADTPELDDVLLVAKSPDHLFEILLTLATDEAQRDSIADRTRHAVHAAHDQAAWLRSLNRALSPVGLYTPEWEQIGAPFSTSTMDVRLAQVQAKTGWAQGVQGARVMNAPYLPLGSRLRLSVGTREASVIDRLKLVSSARLMRWLRARTRKWREHRP